VVSARAFPVIYTNGVRRLVDFYELLGFEEEYQFPPEGEPGYVSLGRGDDKLGIVDASSPKELIGIDIGSEPRFELFIYVDDLKVCVDRLRAAGVYVLREAAEMPWGERLAYVADPDGNPVALAQ
jgi:lactoylglutathione lyase